MSYLPDMSGRYTITIKYGGDEIPYSPFRIHALPTGDASKCLVTGGLSPHLPLPSPSTLPTPRPRADGLTLFFLRSVYWWPRPG